MSRRQGFAVLRASCCVLRAFLFFLFLMLPAPLWACPICFRFEQGPVTAGMRVAIVVLMAVTGGVLTGFAMFIRRFVRRARR